MTGSVSMPAVVTMLLLLLELLAPLLPPPPPLLLPPPPPPPFMALPLAAVGEPRLPLWCAWIGGLLGSPGSRKRRVNIVSTG